MGFVFFWIGRRCGAALGAAALFSSAAYGAQPAALAFVDATVFDATGAPPRVATVIVRGRRIEAVGRGLPIPSGSRVIPADGMTLIPGMFDLHAHVPYAAARGVRGDWIKNLYAYLASGVTTVVDFGRDPESFEPVRRALKIFDAPDLLLAARFTTPLGHGAELGRDWFSAEVLTPAQAQGAFDRTWEDRPDVLKVFTDGWRYGAAPEMTSMREDTLRTLVEAAHQRGVKVLTHTVTLERAKLAARAGVDGLAHAVSDREADAELIGLLRDKDVCYVPTMAVYEPSTPDPTSPGLTELMEPEVRRQTPGFPGGPATGQVVVSERRRRRWANIQHNTKALHEGGVVVAVGSDAGVTGTFHGWASLRELELLVEAGLTPADALLAATRNSARCLGLLDDRGTIEAGKRADLVLIDGRPHQEISDVWRIRRVFLGGREIPRDGLIRAIQQEGPVVAVAPTPAAELIDDFESSDGRSAAGSKWRADFERGHDVSRVEHSRVWRRAGDHSFLILVQLAHREEPFVRVSVPLSRGAVEAVDASSFEGVRFEARGDGTYRFLAETLEARTGDDYGARFEAGAEWKTVAIPFSSLLREGDDDPIWNPGLLLSLAFEFTGPPGARRYLEIDNLRFYRGEAAGR